MSQLLAKALSTSSEEEAIACLRMACKRNEKIEGSALYRGNSAEYWFNKAYAQYISAKTSYSKIERLCTEYSVKNSNLQIELRSVKSELVTAENNVKFYSAVSAIIASAITTILWAVFT